MTEGPLFSKSLSAHPSFNIVLMCIFTQYTKRGDINEVSNLMSCVKTILKMLFVSQYFTNSLKDILELDGSFFF